MRNDDPKQSVVIESGATFSAMGHNAMIRDSDGQLWSFYHEVDSRQPLLERAIPGDHTNRRVLLRTKIDFIHGWPAVHL